jgi:hypothetical protein
MRSWVHSFSVWTRGRSDRALNPQVCRQRQKTLLRTTYSMNDLGPRRSLDQAPFCTYSVLRPYCYSSQGD